MAQDTPPPGGLLSKVVKFVRNPTVNWSELDQVDARESQYSKHVLKELIERKRANDFVRKREFDQLRKLRQRASAGGDALAATVDDSGFLDSDQPAGPGQREGTLKKIDEIEAQMARQQWQRPEPPAVDAVSAHQFAATIDADAGADQGRVTDFAATDIQPRDPIADALELRDDAPVPDLLPGLDLALVGVADASGWMADPALEEAAIRFANGDDAGCEAALLSLVAVDAPAAPQKRAWAALFDLYRATGQRARFDTLALDFSARHLRSAPPWMAIGAATSGGADASLADDASSQWQAPVALDAGQVTALAVQLAGRPLRTLRLDWSALERIEAEALAPLCDLLSHWAGLALHVVCCGTARFEQMLRENTVSGQRTPLGWWRLRLAWLRLTQRADAFDLVALDYCITHGVPPPSWEDPRCTVAFDDAVGPSDVAAGWAARAPAGVASADACAALVGVVAGDASPMLTPSVVRPSPAGSVRIDCTALVRIDFAAAGSVLNWASAQQSAGRQVEFVGLHALVAIFFHVIGVAEHASIRMRDD
jgi:ABC-type transporter Mla MlaB component